MDITPEKPDYSEQVARYKAFMLLTGALVFVLVGCTLALLLGKIDPAVYEKVLLTLGVPTLLGMAFHAFFNENKEETKDAKKIEVNHTGYRVYFFCGYTIFCPGSCGEDC